MVEKFNFFDIYGYLVPGLVLTGLLWIPFGMFFHQRLPQDVALIVLALVLSYFAGQLLHGFSDKFLPSAEKGRAPSDRILDSDNTAFTAETKGRIDRLSQQYFELALGCGTKSGEVSQEISDSRKDAFFLARSALLRDKKTSYWEQFDGLYNMMRNVTAALGAAAFYFLGWSAELGRHATASLSVARTDVLILILLLATVVLPLVLALGAVLKKNVNKWMEKWKKNDEKKKVPSPEKRYGLKFWLKRNWPGLVVLTVAFLAGMRLAATSSQASSDPKPVCPSSPITVVACPAQSDASAKDTGRVAIAGTKGWVMLLLGIVALAIAWRFYKSYQLFAWSFAEHVWRDFANIETKWTKPETPVASQLFE